MAKWLVIGDLHFGEKGDSPKYNNYLLDFIDSCIKDYKGKVKGVIQLGDYFHHQTKIRLDTLNFALEGIKRISEAFGKENVYVLEGNHDLYYDDRLDVSSVRALEPYCTLIDSPTLIGDENKLLLTPWVVSGEMYDNIVSYSRKAKAVFGHFEFNGFKMNDHYVMENGQSHRALKNFQLVVSGHYHSFQEKDNVVYVGTPLPITMNEANEEHYVMIFDDEDCSYTLEPYKDISVMAVSYEEFIELAENPTFDPKKTTIRVDFPDDLEDESAIDDVKAILEDMGFDEYRIRYRGNKVKQLMEASTDEISNVENIDESVVKSINGMVPIEGIDKNILVSFYNLAKSKSKDMTNE